VHLAHAGDRAQLTVKGAMAALTEAAIPGELVRSARHLHVSSYYLLDGLRPGLPALARAARGAGASVSLNPQADPEERWDADLGGLAALVDVLFVNEMEDAAIDSSGFPLVVVKRGARGAAARWADGAAEHPGIPAEVIDTTGAGDSFDAGFLASRLAGEPVEQALALACACGALSTRAAGGVAAQPTLEDARAALEVVRE
jgi:sugar/nucleoside kinase (ribokinase family)